MDAETQEGGAADKLQAPSSTPESPVLAVESDIESSPNVAVPSPEPPPINITAAANDRDDKRKSLEESGEELLAAPWCRRCSGKSFRQPTSPNGPRHESYPSFLNSRRSVNMSSCSSPNVFRTLQKSPSRKANLDETYPALDPKVIETMKELDELRKKCEREGNYMEASAVVAKLHKLKSSEDEKRRVAMFERHTREKEMAKKAYVSELDERNRLWDDKLKNFHREVMEHASQLKRQHTAALQSFRSKMASRTPSKPQWSSELLRLRKVQERLGKLGKYMDAQELKRQADQLEQAELQATLHAFQNEVATKEHALRARQQVELEVLLQRAAQARDELRNNREQDLERCHQRHRNVVRELNVIHSQESFRFDHYLGKAKGDVSRRRASFRKSVSATGQGRSHLVFEEDVGSD